MSNNENTRPIDSAILLPDSGPYLAKVVSHLDNKFMGSLQVQILKINSSGTAYDNTDRLVTAFYASPFYGSTSWKSTGSNDDYSSTQQSYGMWFVPPDPDTKVLVTFVEGRRDICYWFACVPDDYMNFMVPDGRAATTLSTSGSGGATGRKLPVGEYNKRLIPLAGNNQPTNYVKPVNTDFVNSLTEEGLLEDDFRGLTSSSARREIPSSVFGINTPGPLDKRPGAPRATRGPLDASANVPRSRLGGSSIVMDDGDDKLLRSQPANEGPPVYIERETDSSTLPPGAETRPANELIRLRTRTGHQILLHNTEDLIYIANARGTTWIELTSNGKIDVYAQDSISMHTEGEFNVTADSNINLTSGGNVNINAVGDIRNTGRNLDSIATGRVAFQASSEFSALAGDYMSLKSSSDLALTSGAASVNVSGGSNVEINSGSDVNLIADGGSVRVSASSNFDVTAGTQVAMIAPEIHDSSNLRVVSAEAVHLNAASNLYASGGSIDLVSSAAIVSSAGGRISFKSGGNFEVGSTNLSVSSGSIDFEGNSSITGTIKTSNVEAPAGEFNAIKYNSKSGAAAVAPTYSASDPGDAEPATDSVPPGTASKTDGPAPTEPSAADITARVPQHEPWFQHENLDPTASNVRAGSAGAEVYILPLPDTFLNIGRNNASGSAVSYQSTGQSPNPGFGESDQEEESFDGYNFNQYNNNVSRVVEYFEANGFETWVGAGIAGALIWESGTQINVGAYLPPNDKLPSSSNPIPGNTSSSYGARGICQWRGGGTNGRLTNVEKFLGKSLLQQPITDPFLPEYRIRSNRLPTARLDWVPPVYVVPANTTLEEQLSVIIWEWENDESRTLESINQINSGSNVIKARRVAEIFNDDYLRSNNPQISIGGGRTQGVKELRASSAQEVYRAVVSGRGTAPIFDPLEISSSPLTEDGSDPAANARPRNESDTIDLTTTSNSQDIITGSAGIRRGPLRPEFRSALNRAARDSGIYEIKGTSFANECLRRINTSTQLPLSNWRTFPSRASGPDADLREVNDVWLKLNRSTGRFETRTGSTSSGPGWRYGTERHDTGLAIDAYLMVLDGDQLRALVPTNQADRARMEAFVTAFARYGGRGVGIGGNGSTMAPGLNHYDMLGGHTASGWNRRITSWTYGNGNNSWVMAALNRGVSVG